MADATTPHWATAFIDLSRRDFERGVVFWAEVTGYDVSSARGDADEFATLVPPDGDDFLRVQRLVEGGGGIHLDLHVDDPRAAADRAVALGAVEHGQHPEHGYVVLASPGGLTFCFVTQPASRRPRAARWPGGRSLVDQVCLDVGPSAYDRECAFWRDVTGWELDPAGPGEEFGALVRPDGQPLRFLLQRLDDEQPVATAHLDLACEDRAAETRRHEALGATVRDVQSSCTVLADPTGAAYCLTDRSPTGTTTGTTTGAGA